METGVSEENVTENPETQHMSYGQILSRDVLLGFG